MNKPKAKSPAKRTTKAAPVAKSSQASTKAKKTEQGSAQAVDQRISDLGDWRGETLARMRSLILAADPEMIEDVKWRKPSNSMAGVAVWSHDGIVCTGEPYKNYVKLTFANGVSLPDPKGLFNAGLNGGTRRAIDLREGEEVNAKAFQALIKAAVEYNTSQKKPTKPAAKAAKPVAKTAKMNKLPKNANGVVLLSGGNPQIAKGDGDAPVQTYIANMPGWKSDLGKRLDEIIVRNAPDVRKAVKWNSPFYGIEGLGWFVSFHVFTRYVKVTFFNGVSLKPVPPGSGKDTKGRWLDIYEDDEFDEAQMAAWVKQAAAIPGWIP